MFVSRFVLFRDPSPLPPTVAGFRERGDASSRRLLASPLSLGICGALQGVIGVVDIRRVDLSLSLGICGALQGLRDN
jgi:hypothetical protein